MTCNRKRSNQPRHDFRDFLLCTVPHKSSCARWGTTKDEKVLGCSCFPSRGEKKRLLRAEACQIRGRILK
jgi:hypothetical protein